MKRYIISIGLIVFVGCIIIFIFGNNRENINVHKKIIPKIDQPNEKENFEINPINVVIDIQKISESINKIKKDDLEKYKNKENVLGLLEILKKDVYNEIDTEIQRVVEEVIKNGPTGSWYGEGDGIVYIRKKRNPNYKELRVWKIKDNTLNSSHDSTYIEMTLDGSDYGRIIQLKNNEASGFCIDLYNRHLHTIRQRYGHMIQGPEISYQQNSDSLLAFSWFENGKVVGPAFFWDENENLIDFKYHDKPTYYPRARPAPLRLPDK